MSDFLHAPAQKALDLGWINTIEEFFDMDDCAKLALLRDLAELEGHREAAADQFSGDEQWHNEIVGEKKRVNDDPYNGYGEPHSC